MAKVELNIVALGDFSSVNTQIKVLQENIAVLQKGLAGVGLSTNLTKDLQGISAQFKQTMLSTGQFTASTVAMSTETERFGTALATGKLKLSDYYNIIKQRSSEALTQFKALALEQTKLQNSIVMSDPTKQGILNVYTPTQIDKVANATKIAANEANLYALAVNKGSQELINFGKNTQWAGRQLTVGMSVPIMIFGQQAVASFDAVNVELTRLQRLYGEGLTPPSQQELTQISDQVMNLGKQIAGSMGIAQTETVKAAANFAAMGKQGQDLLNVTQQTMRLSKLGAVSTADATNTVVALQNVYKVSTMDLAGAVNFLSDIQKQTTMTLGDMTQAIPRVGPIMQQLGGTYKDTAVMLVAMREAGVPAAQAANALKSAVASMIAPTAAASKEWQQYGINLTAIRDQTQGNPVQMLKDLQQGLQNLSPLVREQLIDKLFGKFQFARVSALLDNFGKTGSQTLNALKIANASQSELATLANQEMAQATSSPTAQYQRALQTFKADLVPVGQKIVELATKLMSFGNAVAKVFSGLPGPIKTVAGFLAIGTVLAGPIIMLTGLLANFAGFILKGVFNIKQLITGGKTLGQLLTPEFIAAQNASKIFGTDVMNNVSDVELLSKAIADLTRNIEAMVSAMGAGTDINSLTSSVAAVAQSEIRMYEQQRLPGFAAGGVIVNGPGTGTSDSIIARISNGESIISAENTKRYLPLIQAMVNGDLPKFMAGGASINKKTKNYGTDASGEGAWLSEPGEFSSSGTGLSGTALMISEISGDAAKVPAIVEDSLSRLKKFVTNQFGDSWIKNVSQNDLAHRSMGENTPENQKVFKANELYGVTHAENAPLSSISELYSKAGTKDDTAVVQAQRSYIDKIINSAAKEIDGITPKNVADLQAGVQPVTEAEQKLYQKVLQKVSQDIESGAGEFVSGGKVSGLGAQMYVAKDLVSARLDGGLTSVENTQASKYIDSDKSTPAALTAFKKSTNYDAATGRRAFDTAALANPAVAISADLEKPLKQQLKILQEAKVQDVKAIQDAQNAITKAQLQGAANRMKELEKEKATDTEEYVKLAQSIAQGYDKGITSSIETTSAKSKEFINSVLIEMKSAARIHSPSELTAEEIGQPMGQGVTVGMQQALPGMEGMVIESMTKAANAAGGDTKPWWMAGKRYAQSVAQGINADTPEIVAAAKNAANEASAQIGPLMENGSFTSKTGLFGKLKGMVFNSEGKMNIQSKMAGSTALMMGGNAIAGMLPKGSNASNIAGSISNMAGMGMMFGPWGAAAGAAIGLVTSGIGALMKAEHEHQAIAKATFTAAGSAITMFGGTMQQTSNQIIHFNDALEKSGITSKKSLSEIDQMANAIGKLGKGDATKTTADAIKKYNGVGPVVGTLKQFAAAQVAAGMDPKGVAKMVAAMLQYAGKTQYLKAALKEIVPATQSVGAAQQTLLSKLTAAAGASYVEMQANNGVIKSYKDMNAEQKNLADGFGTVGMSMLNSSADSKSLIASMNALDKSGLDAYTSGTMLAAKLKDMGQTDLANRFTQINGTVKDTGKSMMIATAEADGLIKNLDKLALTKLIKDPKAMATLAAQIAKYNQDAAAAAAKQAAADAAAQAKKDAAAAAAADAAAKAKVFKGTAEEQDAQKRLTANKKAQDSVLKTLKDQLSMYQKQTAELKRMRDLDMQRNDLNNQMKDALISGNYLGAAQLGQAKSALQVDFNSTTMENKMQANIDQVQVQADAFAQSLADLTDAISQGVKVLDPNIKAAAHTAVIRPGAVDASIGASVITQNFVINGGDIQAVHQTINAATKQATGKSAISKHKINPAKSSGLPSTHKPGGK